MVKPVDFEVGGLRYQTIPLTGFQSLELDRTVTGISLQAFGSLGRMRTGGKAGAAIGIAMAIADVVREMPKEAYRELVVSTFSQTVALSETGKDVPLAGEAVANHFTGRFLDMYECMYKVWEANQFSPFVMLERFGVQTAPTPT